MSAAETQLDLDRITHPLRLARGSHRPRSGKGCAMNAISYTNGDTASRTFLPARPVPWLSSSSRATTCWPGPAATCHRKTACSRSNSPGRPWEPPTSPTPLCTPGWPNCWPTPSGALFSTPKSPRSSRSSTSPSCTAALRAATCLRLPPGTPPTVPTRRPPRDQRHVKPAAGAFAVRAAYESTAVVNVRALPVDAGRRDRIRRAGPRPGHHRHRSQPHSGTGQTRDPLMASSRWAGQLRQRSDIGPQSAQSRFAGRASSPQ